jgi:hypothetical protein
MSLADGNIYKAPNGWLQNVMLSRHIKDFMNHISVLLITSATICVITCVSMVGINFDFLHFRTFICILQLISHWKYSLEILYWKFTCKYFEKIRSFYKLDRNMGHFT